MPTSRSRELREVAERITTALPSVIEEVVLTGSVSRGFADEISDIEMLLVTTTRLDLAECFDHASRLGLVDLDTWGLQATEVSRVFGYYEGIPIKTIWWSREWLIDQPAQAGVGSDDDSLAWPSVTFDALACVFAELAFGAVGAVQDQDCFDVVFQSCPVGAPAACESVGAAGAQMTAKRFCLLLAARH